MTAFNPYSSDSSGGMSFSDALKMSNSMPNNSFSNYSSSFSVPSGFYDYKPGGMSFTEAAKAKAAESDGKEEKGFLDKYLDDDTKKSMLDIINQKHETSEATVSQAKELAKSWQSGALGENLNYLAPPSGDQPLVIGGGGAQQQSGGVTGAIKGGLSAGLTSGFNPITTGIGAVMGFLG